MKTKTLIFKSLREHFGVTDVKRDVPLGGGFVDFLFVRFGKTYAHIILDIEKDNDLIGLGLLSMNLTKMGIVHKFSILKPETRKKYCNNPTLKWVIEQYQNKKKDYYSLSMKTTQTVEMNIEGVGDFTIDNEPAEFGKWFLDSEDDEKRLFEIMDTPCEFVNENSEITNGKIGDKVIINKVKGSRIQYFPYWDNGELRLGLAKENKLYDCGSLFADEMMNDEIIVKSWKYGVHPFFKKTDNTEEINEENDEIRSIKLM